MAGHVAILGLDQYRAVAVDQDSAEGMVAMRQGAARDLEGSPEEMFIAVDRRGAG